MVEDDITIHPQNSLNSGYQGYTKPFYGSNIEYNPKFLSKIKKALEFQCLYRSFYFHWLKQS